jgi:ABC-type Fe3+ transport system permease subunit
MLEGLITSLVVVGFLVIIGLSLMGKAKDTTTADTYERNASLKVLQAMDDIIPDWLGTVVLAVIAIVILVIFGISTFGLITESKKSLMRKNE